MRRDAAISIALAVAVLAIYGPVVRYEFVNYDDGAYVFENRHVKQGLTLDSVIWAFSNTEEANWHPLTWLSHMLDCQLFDLNAGLHHLTNILIHAASSVLLYLVLKRMTGAVWRSAAVAAVFAIHPTHVESVAWVAERKDVLSTFFWVLTTGAYVLYVERPGWGRYWLVVALLALGLMAKPMLVTLPFTLLLLDFWPLKRLGWSAAGGKPGTDAAFWSTARGLVWEKAPLFVMAGIVSVVTYIAQQTVGAMSPVDELPVATRLGNAAISYVMYIGMAFWPGDMAVFYPYTTDLELWRIAGAVVVLAAVTVAAVMAYRRPSRLGRAVPGRPYLAVGWLWYLGTLVPVIGLVQVGSQSMADRFTYIPFVGLFMAIVWWIADLVPSGRRAQIGLGAAWGAALAAWAACAAFQVTHWQNTMTLFGHAIAVTKDNWVAYDNLGAALRKQDKIDEAIAYIREGLRIRPLDAGGHGRYGEALAAKGETQAAITEYQAALRLDSRQPEVHNNFGSALYSLGRRDEAIRQYLKALDGKPDYAEAHHNLALAFTEEGNLTQAESHCRDALRYKPDFAGAHAALGNIFARQGNLNEAMAEYREALRLKPDSTEAHANLAIALASLGRPDEAEAHCREAIRSNPKSADAHDALAAVRVRQRKVAEAIAEYRESLRLRPARASTHYNLGSLVAAQGQVEEAVKEMREAIRLAPDDPLAPNHLAWILATDADPKVRRGAEAVALAEKACALTDRKDPSLLDTLAAAYAEARQWREAVAAAKEAFALAKQNALPELAAAIDERLRLYESRKPYHEPRRPPQ